MCWQDTAGYTQDQTTQAGIHSSQICDCSNHWHRTEDNVSHNQIQRILEKNYTHTHTQKNMTLLSSVHNLEVTLDQELTFSEHV